jgi:hypothetical protein
MSLDELMSLEVFSAASRLPTKRSKQRPQVRCTALRGMILPVWA